MSIGLVQPFHASCRNDDYDGPDEKKGGATEAADRETIHREIIIKQMSSIKHCYRYQSPSTQSANIIYDEVRVKYIINANKAVSLVASSPLSKLFCINL